MAELYLVEFRGSRKEFFYNSYYHNFHIPEHVIVQVDRGEDIGLLTMRIDKPVEFPDDARPRSILRPANPADMQHLEVLRKKEKDYRAEIVSMIEGHGLPMKVVDVECQFDGNKLTAFFSADHRVDFRALVKDMAARYRTRIELRQIGVRDEARRIGGYGICGRRQCCNSFIRAFEPISTQHAREQDLPLNPAKISGNCGRLLCCLRYEAPMYLDCKRRFPKPGSSVKTKQGDGIIDRIDIFNEEAVIISHEERVFFRCQDRDIYEVEGEPVEPQRPRTAEAAGEEASEEDLKKLEGE
jgi:cell fate regulator YaaT (PSP1 superfamily)